VWIYWSDYIKGLIHQKEKKCSPYTAVSDVHLSHLWTCLRIISQQKKNLYVII